jgi:hypothetical protein
MSLLDLLSIQAGTQSSWATGVTPTVKLMGVEDLVIDPGITAEAYHDRRGSAAPAHLAALTAIMPTAKMDVLATYEDHSYYLDNLCGQASPSGSGPYTRNHAATGTAITAPRLLGLSYGDATDYRRFVGGLISKLTAKGENGAPLRHSTEWIGNTISTTALAALSDRTVNLAMGDHAAIYVDAWGGTIGATALTVNAFAFELTVDAKRKGDQFFGALAAGNYHEDDGAEGWEGELKLSLELNGNTRSELTAATHLSTLYQRQVRIAYTSGTNVIQYDFAGFQEGAPELFKDRNGVLMFEIVLKGLYNPTLGNWFKSQNVNSVATLA